MSLQRGAMAEQAGVSEGTLRGIDGWLLLFVVGLLGEIVLAGLGLEELTRPALRAITDPEVVASLREIAAVRGATIAADAIGLALIFTRSRYTPAYFAVAIPAKALLLVELSSLVAGLARSPASPTRDGEAGAALWLSIIWTVYWCRSKRVRATFGSVGIESLPWVRRLLAPLRRYLAGAQND